MSSACSRCHKMGIYSSISSFILTERYVLTWFGYHKHNQHKNVNELPESELIQLETPRFTPWTCSRRIHPRDDYGETEHCLFEARCHTVSITSKWVECKIENTYASHKSKYLVQCYHTHTFPSCAPWLHNSHSFHTRTLLFGTRSVLCLEHRPASGSIISPASARLLWGLQVDDGRVKTPVGSRSDGGCTCKIHVPSNV